MKRVNKDNKGIRLIQRINTNTEGMLERMLNKDAAYLLFDEALKKSNKKCEGLGYMKLWNKWLG